MVKSARFAEKRFHKYKKKTAWKWIFHSLYCQYYTPNKIILLKKITFKYEKLNFLLHLFPVDGKVVSLLLLWLLLLFKLKKNQNRTLIWRNCCIKNEFCSLAFADKNLIYPVSKFESNMTVNREMEVVMNKALDISILKWQVILAITNGGLLLRRLRFVNMKL